MLISSFNLPDFVVYRFMSHKWPAAVYPMDSDNRFSSHNDAEDIGNPRPPPNLRTSRPMPQSMYFLT